jgi:hypothetical protein
MTVIEALITLALSNFTVTFLVLGLVAAGVSLLRKRKPLTRAVIVEELLAFFLLFEIGLGNLYNFVMHVFFGEMTASFIGWAQSPFQAEVGFASLGFAVVGLMAFRAGFGLRLAAITGPACFLLGAAGGHIYQMVVAKNFALGNAGVIFYSDLFIPLLGFLLLWLHRSSGRATAEKGTSALGV